jgi:hypothetical protein
VENGDIPLSLKNQWFRWKTPRAVERICGKTEKIRGEKTGILTAPDFKP